MILLVVLGSFQVCLFVASVGRAEARFPERIVSLAPNITETIYALSLQDRLVGVTQFCNFPPQAREKPKVGGFSTPSLEMVLRERPDVVVVTQEGHSVAMRKKLQQLGVRVVVFNTTTIKDLPRAIKAAGMALAVTGKAKDLSQRLQVRLKGIAGRSHGEELLTGVFIIQIDPLIVAGSGSHLAEVMDILNIKNIARSVKGRYPRLSVETIAASNPDVILLGPCCGDVTILQKKLSRQAGALNAGKLIRVDERLLRLSPRIVDALESLETPLRR